MGSLQDDKIGDKKYENKHTFYILTSTHKLVTQGSHSKSNTACELLMRSLQDDKIGDKKYENKQTFYILTSTHKLVTL